MLGTCAADALMSWNLVRGTGMTCWVSKFVWYHFWRQICVDVSTKLTIAQLI